MARSLVELEILCPLSLSQYASLVSLVLVLLTAASNAPIACHGLATCLSGGQQLLEASAEHGAHHDHMQHAAAVRTSAQFLGETRASDSVLVFQTSDCLFCSNLTTLDPPSGHEPPVRVVIASPTKTGTFPVILFKHGFAMLNCFYIELFELLATSGYIVVAPQYILDLKDLVFRDCNREIEQTAAVANWIPSSLQLVLNVAIPDGNVVPNVSRIVVAGHSRGGKIAFALALGKASTKVPSFSALVALDPVDCLSVNKPSDPSLVEPGCNHTENQIAFPVLILGTGYGSEGFFPCAPTGCNHAAYFNCSSAPIMYHLVASEYGHLDFLDVSDQYKLFIVCKSACPGTSLYRFSSELIVAFLESALYDNQASMDNLLETWKSSWIKLEEPQVYMEDDALY